MALYAICVQIFRHIAQKSLDIRQYACGISRQSAEKSGNAPYAQALCGIALTDRIVQLFIQRNERTIGFLPLYDNFFNRVDLCLTNLLIGIVV